jgi:hypothetical protein
MLPKKNNRCQIAAPQGSTSRLQRSLHLRAVDGKTRSTTQRPDLLSSPTTECKAHGDAQARQVCCRSAWQLRQGLETSVIAVLPQLEAGSKIYWGGNGDRLLLELLCGTFFLSFGSTSYDRGQSRCNLVIRGEIFSIFADPSRGFEPSRQS